MKKFQFGVIATFVMIAFFVVVALFATYKVPYEPKQRLLVLMIGGFRYDYVTRDQANLIGFPRLRLEGVRAEHLTPVFPSDSYPNWYTAATGLYPESTGIFHKKFFNRTTNQLLIPKIEPIWTRALRKGQNATVLYWDGCQLDFMENQTSPGQANKPGILTCIPQKEPTDWDSPTIFRDFTRILYSVLDDFAKDRTSLAMVYYPVIDMVGHRYGPDSNETINAVRDLDLIIYNLLNQLDRRQLSKSANVYVLSDHGMSAPHHKIKLENYVNLHEVKIMIGDLYARGKGTFGMLLPYNPNDTDHIYEALHGQEIEGLHVYKKEDIPLGFHVKYSDKVGPIMMRAHPDYYIDATNHTETDTQNEGAIGFHGYFPHEFDQMNGVMYAVGPSFRRGFKGEVIEQVDHYQLFCHVLKIRAKPNNGSWVRVRDFIETY